MAFVLDRPHPVLDAAHLEVDHGLPHVLGPLGLAGVGHGRVPGGPGAIEERLHVGAREALLGSPEADGHDDAGWLRLPGARPYRGRSGPWTRSGCR